MLSNQQSINWFCSINKKRVNSKMHDLWIDFYLNKRSSFNTIRMIFDNTNMHSLLHSSTSHHEIAAKSINIRTSWNRNICILIVSPSKFCLQIVILFFFKTDRHCKKCCNAWVCFSEWSNTYFYSSDTNNFMHKLFHFIYYCLILLPPIDHFADSLYVFWVNGCMLSELLC